MYGYDYMIENVILQNGYIISRLSDHNEKVALAIPGHRKYTMKI